MLGILALSLRPMVNLVGILNPNGIHKAVLRHAYRTDLEFDHEFCLLKAHSVIHCSSNDGDLLTVHRLLWSAIRKAVRKRVNIVHWQKIAFNILRHELKDAAIRRDTQKFIALRPNENDEDLVCMDDGSCSNKKICAEKCCAGGSVIDDRNQFFSARRLLAYVWKLQDRLMIAIEPGDTEAFRLLEMILKYRGT